MVELIAQVAPTDLATFTFFVLLVFFALVGLFLMTYSFWRPKNSVSPYTGTDLRSADDLPFATRKKINHYLREYHQYDNRQFDFAKAAVCRETGRVFSNCINWMGVIRLDWTFLKRRYPDCIFVSWGSLSKEQQKEIRDVHESLAEFQTEFSSPEPNPRDIDPQYAYAQPGPLYVDLESKILLGWKTIPDTQLEVLIVQKPTKIIEVNYPKDKKNA